MLDIPTTCQHHFVKEQSDMAPTLLRACTIMPPRCEQCIECCETRQTQVRLRPVQLDNEV